MRAVMHALNGQIRAFGAGSGVFSLARGGERHTTALAPRKHPQAASQNEPSGEFDLDEARAIARIVKSRLPVLEPYAEAEQERRRGGNRIWRRTIGWLPLAILVVGGVAYVTFLAEETTIAAASDGRPD